MAARPPERAPGESVVWYGTVWNGQDMGKAVVEGYKLKEGSLDQRMKGAQLSLIVQVWGGGRVSWLVGWSQ